jgi:hypothetical protein
MRNLLLLLCGCMAYSLLFTACKKTDTTVPPKPDPCLGVTIAPVASKSFTITGQSLGSITVTSPIGSGYVYSIGGAYQAAIPLPQKMRIAAKALLLLPLTDMVVNFMPLKLL